jgi:hypothetical protein
MVVSKITCDSPTRHKARRAGEAEKNMKEKKQYIALFRDLVLAVFARDRVREKGKQMLSETYVDRKNSNCFKRISGLGMKTSPTKKYYV